MTTTKRIAIAAAATLLSLPAWAAGRASAADPTWPASSPETSAITLRGPGERHSSVHGDPTWPDVAVLAPGLRLDTYVAAQPDPGSIDNDGSVQTLRSFARLDAIAAKVVSAR